MAVEFNGSNQYGKFALDLSAVNQITIEAVLKVNSVPGGDNLLFEHSINTNSYAKGFFLDFQSATQLYFYFRDGAVENAGTWTSLIASGWAHRALTFKVDTNPDVSEYFEGGTSKGNGATAGNETGNLGNYDMYICSRGGSSLWLGATIEELRIWNTIRTQAQIDANKSLFIDPATSGLIHLYRFNEGSGSNVEDLVGSSDITLYNSPSWVAGIIPTTNIKVVNGLARSSIKTVNGLAIASVKSINGLA